MVWILFCCLFVYIVFYEILILYIKLNGIGGKSCIGLKGKKIIKEGGIIKNSFLEKIGFDLDGEEC